MYSVANVGSTTFLILAQLQHIELPQCCIRYLYVDCLVSEQLANSASDEPVILESPLVNSRPCLGVCDRYRVMCLRFF